MSVIIPLYNGAETIARTLSSVQAQSWRRLEIIVVDDGSSDAGPAIVRAAAANDRRISLHVRANGGVAAARNAGIMLATGPLIAPVDADDLWSVHKIARQVAALEAAGPQAGLVYSYFDAVDANDRCLWSGPRIEVNGPALEPLLREYFIGNGSNAMMRTDLVRKVGGYDETLRAKGAQGAEDWKIALQLAELADFACVPEVLVGYRRTRGNMSGELESMLRSARLVTTPFFERHPEHRAAIADHIRSHRNWLIARAITEANLTGLIAMARDVGGAGEMARNMTKIAVPVLRQLASSAIDLIRPRRRPIFRLDGD